MSDLTAVARASHLLLALDGFDEVAAVDLRQQLVDEISKGITRLINAGGFSVRTIVTSRPAAFAKSVRFPRDQWAYYELLSLERKHVDAYTDKWMKAKSLKESEKGELRRILDAKLKEAHTQFLAKNPMQLTILLSLIHNRGSSLPEKRTAMYDAYMDMFFSRESEKSDIVRDNRDLLIDIHRYLAWKLQTAAEAGENGSIESGALRKVLLIYLDDQGESTAIVGDLFNGIIERVGALVSRVQETYEFEVQPLREYFVARHLYETAPYSPAGAERGGTKLDRFNALVRNPYWLNAARFYGGCFSKGEVSALVDELVALADSESYRLTSHPRNVALMLLGDWVFAQYQPAVKNIVAFIGNYPYLRQLLADAAPLSSRAFALPDRSGRNSFQDILWERLMCTNHYDELAALAGALVENSSLGERMTRWANAKGELGEREWARLGSLLRIFHLAEREWLRQKTAIPTLSIVHGLVLAGRFDLLGQPEYAKEAEGLLLRDNRLPMAERLGENSGALAWLATICASYQYAFALHDGSTGPLRESLERIFGWSRARESRIARKPQRREDLTESMRAAIISYDAFLDAPSPLISTSGAPWIDLVDKLRACFGDCPAIDRIAFIGAGVRSSDFTGVDTRLAGAADLVSTARFIRLKSGAPRWWEARFQAEDDLGERRRLLLLLALWGTPKTILKLADVLHSVLEALDHESWSALCHDYTTLQNFRAHESGSEIDGVELTKLKKLGTRACMFIGQRLSFEARVELSGEICRRKFADPAPELQFAMDWIVYSLRNGSRWRTCLPLLKDLYSRGASIHHASNHEWGMPDSVAKEICANPEHFPLSLVAAADGKLQSSVGKAAPKLLDVAKSEGWFSVD